MCLAIDRVACCRLRTGASLEGRVLRRVRHLGSISGDRVARTTAFSSTRSLRRRSLMRSQCNDFIVAIVITIVVIVIVVVRW